MNSQRSQKTVNVAPRPLLGPPQGLKVVRRKVQGSIAAPYGVRNAGQSDWGTLGLLLARGEDGRLLVLYVI